MTNFKRTLFTKILLSLLISFSLPHETADAVSSTQGFELAALAAKPLLLMNKLRSISSHDKDIVSLKAGSALYALSRILCDGLALYNRPEESLRYRVPALSIDIIEALYEIAFNENRSPELQSMAEKSKMLVVSLDAIESLLNSYQVLKNTEGLEVSQELLNRSLYALSLAIHYSNEAYFNSGNTTKLALYSGAAVTAVAGACYDAVQYKSELQKEREIENEAFRQLTERQGRELAEARCRMVERFEREQERLERERVDHERLEQEEERERLRVQREHEEQLRSEQEQSQREQAEQERLEYERIERERVERERDVRLNHQQLLERLEQERIEREQRSERVMREAQERQQEFCNSLNSDTRENLQNLMQELNLSSQDVERLTEQLNQQDPNFYDITLQIWNCQRPDNG